MKSFLQTTKTTSLRRSRVVTQIRVLLGIFVIVALLVYAKSILSAAASLISSPFYTLKHYIESSSATVPTYLRDRQSLMEEIRTLNVELASQQGMATTFAQAVRENEELRALLSVPNETRIAAGVIARPPYTPYDTLILDQGSESGIVVHAPVFYGSGIAIGYIRSVTAHNALVTLFSSPGVESSVYVFGPNIFARAYGEGGGITRISIPQGVTVTEGDTVVLPSLSAGVFGTIDVIESVATDPEQHAFVTLAAPIASIRLVSIGTRPVEPITFPEAHEVIEEAARTLFTFPIPESAQGLSTSTPTTTHMINENVTP